jgi:solute carrier family 25 protein 44
MARAIVAQEGLKGLYRGFWPSVATFAPSSAVWWGSYGFWQKLIGMNLNPGHAQSSSSSGGQGAGTGQVVAVQTVSAVLAGCTASLATNPLDVVKTRLQVRLMGEIELLEAA